MRLAFALVLASVAAGCLAPAADTLGGSRASSLLPDLSGVGDPALDAARGRAWWESFVSATPERHAGSPTNLLAARMIEGELAAAGYEVHTFYFVPPGQESPIPAGIRAITGVRKGTVDASHVIAWVAHYDSNEGTIYAAYDDGSGTAVALELARELAKYPSEKTLMPIFFDAEEMGLVASEYFVKQALARGDATFDLVIGHDMTGINCPGHAWRMYQFVGENYLSDLQPVLEQLYAAKLTPAEKACVAFHSPAFRNSDERRFKEAGVPVIRMAGGLNATDYPQYHQPGDTIDFVYQFAGGPANYEKGFALTLKTSYWAAVTFDRLPSVSRGAT